MATQGISLKYQGITVSLEDQSGFGRGSLGLEDIAMVRVSDGTYLSGEALAKKLEDPAFQRQVVGVIDAYGPVLSKPFHNEGQHEWRKIVRFWTAAQPEFWLRYITKNPAEADAKDFALRQEFHRVTPTQQLPPAMQEAVAVHQMLGNIRRLYKANLGLRRFDTLTDQKTIDEQMIGPIVQQYPKAVTALLRDKGHTPMTDAIMKSKVWLAADLKRQLPEWAREIVDGKYVAWTLDDKGIAGVEELLKTPEGIEKHAEQILYYCSLLGELPIKSLGRERYERLATILIAFIDVMHRQQLAGSPVRDIIARALESFNAPEAVTGLTIEQLLQVYEYSKIYVRSYERWFYPRKNQGLSALIVQHMLAAVAKPSGASQIADALIAQQMKNPAFMRTNGEEILTMALAAHENVTSPEVRERLGQLIVKLVDQSDRFYHFYRMTTVTRLTEPTVSRVQALVTQRLHSGDPIKAHEARLAQAMVSLQVPTMIAEAMDFAATGDTARRVDPRQLAEELKLWSAQVSPEVAQVIAASMVDWWATTPRQFDRRPMIIEFFYALHDRLPDSDARAAIGQCAVQYIDQSSSFAGDYGRAVSAMRQEPTKGLLERFLGDVLQSSDERRRTAARIAQWLGQATIPAEMREAFRILEAGEKESGLWRITKDLERNPWLGGLAQEDLSLLAEMMALWMNRSPNRWDSTTTAHDFLYRIHNLLEDMKLRSWIGQKIINHVTDGDRFAWKYAEVMRRGIAEPTASSLKAILRSRRQSTDKTLRGQAIEAAQLVAHQILVDAIPRATKDPNERNRLPRLYAGILAGELIQKVYPHLTPVEKDAVEEVMIVTFDVATPDDPESYYQAIQLQQGLFPIH